MRTPDPICIACGGSGVEQGFAEPKTPEYSARETDRWTRQRLHRPLILKGVDRFLSVDEAARLGEAIEVGEFLHVAHENLSDLFSQHLNSQRLCAKDRAEVNRAVVFEGLFVLVCEVVHFLADRGHPVDQGDILRVAEEQQFLREHFNETPTDPEPDSDE